MGARFWRRAPAPRAAAGLLLVLLVSSSIGASPAQPAGELSARLVCPQRPAPGRVVCEAELEVDAGVLAWADVLVIEAPPFALPLRSRVGQSALFMKSERRQRLQLALAATSVGTGALRVRARAVVCQDAEQRSCRPATREAEARVVVGPITE